MNFRHMRLSNDVISHSMWSHKSSCMRQNLSINDYVTRCRNKIDKLCLLTIHMLARAKGEEKHYFRRTNIVHSGLKDTVTKRLIENPITP